MPPRHTGRIQRRGSARQVFDNGCGIKETVERLGVYPHPLGRWAKQYKDPIIHAKEENRHQEILCLKKEIRRVTEERYLFVLALSLRKRPPHPKGTSFGTCALEYSIKRMCRVLRVHPSGYYIWLKEPESPRAKENKELLKRIEEAYALSNNTVIDTQCIFWVEGELSCLYPHRPPLQPP